MRKSEWSAGGRLKGTMVPKIAALHSRASVVNKPLAGIYRAAESQNCNEAGDPSLGLKLYRMKKMDVFDTRDMGHATAYLWVASRKPVICGILHPTN